MNLHTVFCPYGGCPARYKIGLGNIVAHSQKRQRCKCTTCGHTFSYRRGTIFDGLRTSPEVVIQVLTLLAYGCPLAAIVVAFALDARTVARWVERAGNHANTIHHQHTRRLELQQVQVDELKLKGQRVVVWVAMAIAVGSRLWLGAACSVHRDKHLAKRILTWVYDWAQHGALVISFDGWSAYPAMGRKVFREPRLTGRRGGPKRVLWPKLTLVQLVKTVQQRFVFQRWVLSGSCTMLKRLLERSQGRGTINTAYIERLNATFRQRLACCARRTRCPARHVATVEALVWLVGGLYNFCQPHASLRSQGVARTPAMAAGLTPRVWSVADFFWWHPRPFLTSTV
jgi:transposase-like protein